MKDEIKPNELPGQWPLVTIAIPTYNGGKALNKALASVWEQSYPNLEILIADNASTNETMDICHELVKNHSQIKYFRHATNIGMFANFQFLLQHATGKYFMWLADDDTLAKGVLLNYVEFFEKHDDYSIVSGMIEYWLNGKPCEYERDFNFEQESALLRVIGYYFKVVHGALFHGLQRTSYARQIPILKIIGSDWHFAASLAFLGKIKNFDFVGYRKKFGGTSRNYKHYAESIGESRFAGTYPHLKISRDAFREVMFNSTVFSILPFFKRVLLASASSIAILISYYVKIHPFVIGGKLKRALTPSFKKPIVAHWNKTEAN